MLKFFQMVIVEDLLVSDDVLQSHFVCNLNACKGACCWEGDFGAPLDEVELPIMIEILEHVKPYLSAEGIAAIEQKGPYTWFEESQEYGTTLLDNGPCAFMNKNELGIAYCGIEKAWQEGKINWKKPISCHLYPIRVLKNKSGEDYALNYDRWDICRNACNDKLQVPLFRFVKDALIRRYGEEFYDQLEGLHKFLEQNSSEDAVS